MRLPRGASENSGTPTHRPLACPPAHRHSSLLAVALRTDLLCPSHPSSTALCQAPCHASPAQGLHPRVSLSTLHELPAWLVSSMQASMRALPYRLSSAGSGAASGAVWGTGGAGAAPAPSAAAAGAAGGACAKSRAASAADSSPQRWAASSSSRAAARPWRGRCMPPGWGSRGVKLSASLAVGGDAMGGHCYTQHDSLG